MHCVTLTKRRTCSTIPYMDLTLTIPDDLAVRLGAADLRRQALEAHGIDASGPAAESEHHHEGSTQADALVALFGRSARARRWAASILPCSSAKGVGSARCRPVFLMRLPSSPGCSRTRPRPRPMQCWRWWANRAPSCQRSGTSRLPTVSV